MSDKADGISRGVSVVQENGIFTASPTSTRPVERYAGNFDRAYFGYYASKGLDNGWVGVRCWDNKEKKVSDEFILWDDWGYDHFGKNLGDDHAAPSIIVLKYQRGENHVHNGKVLAAAAEHGSYEADRGRLQVRRSSESEDISSWDTPVTLESKNNTYANLIEASNGTVWLFVRRRHQGCSYQSLHYWKSQDAGETWDGPSLVADWYKHVPMSMVYFAVCENVDHSEIHVMFNFCYTVGRRAFYRDIYHAYYDVKSSTWKTKSGELLTVPFVIGAESDNCADLVYKTQGEKYLFGENESGSVKSDPDQIFIQLWKSSASGKLSSLRYYGSEQGKIKVAVYANNNGKPGELLLANNEAQVVQSPVNKWYVAFLGGSIEITKGDSYWLAVVSDKKGVVNHRGAGTASGVAFGKHHTFNNDFPNSLNLDEFWETASSRCINAYQETDRTDVIQVMVDGEGEVSLLSMNRPSYSTLPGMHSTWGQVNLHYYNNGWRMEGIHPSGTGRGGTYLASANFEGRNPNAVYLTPFDGNKKTQLQRWERLSGKWTKTDDITSGTLGHNIRPHSVRNGEGGLLLLWSYVERYDGFLGGQWKSTIMACFR
uniref:BNR-4 repeat-containing protein n=1 Tax=Alcaligenes faecalis TaxID=511 RepID=UPI003D042068